MMEVQFQKAAWTLGASTESAQAKMNKSLQVRSGCNLELHTEGKNTCDKTRS
jgi:hypothetical protein